MAHISLDRPSRKGLGFRDKISVLAAGSVLLTVVALVAVITWQSQQYTLAAAAKVDEITSANLREITQQVRNVANAQGDAAQEQVDANLDTAAKLLAEAGAIELSAQSDHWTAVNEQTHEWQELQLPKVLVGKTWLGHNVGGGVETPVVDRIAALISTTLTVFERMNPQGDMLRVASNARAQDGTRAIGTFVPAANRDGSANPVIAAMLDGRTYRGLTMVNNARYVTAYKPLYDAGGTLVGMLYVGMQPESIASLHRVVHETRVGASGYAYVLGGRGDLAGHYIISHDGTRDGEDVSLAEDANGQRYIQNIIDAARALPPGAVASLRYDWKDGAAPARTRLAYFAYYQPWDWIIVADAYQDEMQAYQADLQDGRTRMILGSGALGLAAAVLVGLFAVLVARSLARPLVHLTGVATRIAAGDLTLVAHVAHRDEVGELAVAFNSMTEQLRGQIAALERRMAEEQAIVGRYAAHMAEVGQGRLSARLPVDEHAGAADGSLAALGRHLNSMTVSLQSTIAQIRHAGAALSSSAAEILAATTQQAAGAAQQSAAIAQTSTTVDELRVISEQSTRRAHHVTGTSEHTVEVAHSGQLAVQQTIDGMAHIKERVESIAENILALSEQTQQIGEIIATVNDIAGQSNMLALNASVEAARAGEHGKGFAVVAAEVRNLASQSRQATAQIKDILSEIQKATNSTVMATEEGTKGVDEGVQLAAQARQAIEQLTGVIDEWAQAATQVAVGGQQQVTGVEQIGMAMKNINQATVQSLASTQQAERAAQQLNALAGQLMSLVDRYEV